ncbi:MAG: sulfotransferase domain-containing protein [Phycisphaerales bacterium]|nr:sulfotransferase domain-containing protein [Phycisphaerales bacterium]
MSSRRQYERPGGRVQDEARTGRVPAFLRGKPFRRLQREFCQRYYRYPHRNLLITALPKSGSTWLENMLLEVPGHFRWFPRAFNRQTLKDADFHELPRDEFIHPPPGYTVAKVHAGPSPHNQALLKEVGRPFIILVRDPRDIAASWIHFVRIRPENAYHVETADLDLPQRIDHFTETLLDRFLDWALGWKECAEACRGHLVRYEDLLADTAGELRTILRHLDLELSDAWVNETVQRHSFKATTGREAGQADEGAFHRKGISGDWTNCFTPDNVARFRAVDGGRLAHLGYAWPASA